MLKVFYGDNRAAATGEIKKLLGEDYEVIDSADLTENDLPSLFLGLSLFASHRKILLRDFFANKSVAAQLENFLNTPHDIIILETKLDKRSVAYKNLKDKIEFKEFPAPRDPNAGLVFDIYKIAKTDGLRAVKMLEQIKETTEPIMFLGLMISQALKDFSAHPGEKEKRALRELSKLDMQLKSESKLRPWLLVQSFLLRLSSLR